MDARQKMETIVKVLDNKKAVDIRVLDISGITIIADYFVLCSGRSTTQVKALTDEVEFQLDEAGVPCQKKEGKQGYNWMLMDYGDVVVHIFHEETREFYALEKLWADADEVDVAQIVEEA